MIHKISEFGLEDFTRQIGKLTKKAEKLGLDTVGFTILNDEIISHETLAGKTIGIRYFTVEIFGVSPKLAGWTFVAKIEHGENGNIVFSMSEDTKIEDYRETENQCDHCNISRFRVNTYVIRHENGDYKQVGSTCLVDFMGHPDAEKIAEFYASDWFTTSSEDDFDEDKMGDLGSGKFSFPVVDFVGWTMKTVEKWGWVSVANSGMNHPATKNVAFDLMLDKDSGKLTDEEKTNAENLIAKCVKILESKSKLSDYEWNLLTLIKRDFIRYNHTGFVASVVSFYNRAIEKIVVAENGEKIVSEHIGTVGEKVFNLPLEVVFYTSLEGMYGTTHLYKFADGSGNKITWFTSNDQSLEVGDSLVVKVATIKKHDTYNGEKQTIITRAKIA